MIRRETASKMGQKGFWRKSEPRNAERNETRNERSNRETERIPKG